MTESLSLETWLREQCAEYAFDVGGVYQVDGHHAYPLVANDAADLRGQLDAGGHLLPLPKESAALANVLEVSIVAFLISRIAIVAGADVVQGTERGYPDLEISGEAFGGGFHAIDIKAARRAMSTSANKRGQPRNATQSAITLYTGNTYFRHPTRKFAGTFRPFAEYQSHLDVIAIYTLDVDTSERVKDLELIVQQPWKIASKQRSSTTREYIGAVKNIDAIRDGNGAFATPEEFYTFWRAYRFKTARVVEQMFQKLADEET
ncbi:type II restriction endonuclease [Mycobacterium sp. Aquia_213]|uniref:type II restriction endonuclease n=1 Tax=Mycobacterium sp. Aquia_213 TaxID=2991728 RepID=UPI00227052EE|nr:type II restriction endonuclease [Mycobacterium sp. Aquia_213]WAC93483.1 restriction endonuclease [Mycobacterium sp. Aquia_213]